MIDFDESTASALYGALKTSFPDAKVGPPELTALAACAPPPPPPLSFGNPPIE